MERETILLIKEINFKLWGSLRRIHLIVPYPSCKSLSF